MCIYVEQRRQGLFNKPERNRLPVCGGNIRLQLDYFFLLLQNHTGPVLTEKKKKRRRKREEKERERERERRDRERDERGERERERERGKRNHKT